MKTSQKGFTAPLLLAFVVVLLIGGGAYVYVQNKQASQRSVISPPVQTNPTAQAPNSQIADWETYRNTKYGFEFKYPQDHIVYSGFKNDMLVTASPDSEQVNIAVDESKAVCCEPISLSFTVGNVTDRMFEDSRFEWEMINGYQVFLLKGEGNLGSAYKTLHIKLPSGYWITILQSAQSDFLDKILSTLKFNP